MDSQLVGHRYASVRLVRWFRLWLIGWMLRRAELHQRAGRALTEEVHRLRIPPTSTDDLAEADRLARMAEARFYQARRLALAAMKSLQRAK